MWAVAKDRVVMRLLPGRASGLDLFQKGAQPVHLCGSFIGLAPFPDPLVELRNQVVQGGGLLHQDQEGVVFVEGLGEQLVPFAGRVLGCHQVIQGQPAEGLAGGLPGEGLQQRRTIVGDPQALVQQVAGRVAALQQGTVDGVQQLLDLLREPVGIDVLRKLHVAGGEERQRSQRGQDDQGVGILGGPGQMPRISGECIAHRQVEAGVQGHAHGALQPGVAHVPHPLPLDAVLGRKQGLQGGQVRKQHRPGEGLLAAGRRQRLGKQRFQLLAQVLPAGRPGQPTFHQARVQFGRLQQAQADYAPWRALLGNGARAEAPGPKDHPRALVGKQDGFLLVVVGRVRPALDQIDQAVHRLVECCQHRVTDRVRGDSLGRGFPQRERQPVQEVVPCRTAGDGRPGRLDGGDQLLVGNQSGMPDDTG
jgi:hypothetical protein